MRALVIAPQPFFTPRGTPFSVYYRTLTTAELGIKIDLLTYGAGDDVDIRGVRIIRIPYVPFLGHVKIGPSYLKLFLDILLVFWAFGLLLLNRYDFVHAHEESVFICRFLKPIFRFKMVYDMHSCLPEQLSNFQFTTSRTIIAIFKMLEKTCLRNADAIITICPKLHEYVNSLIPKNGKTFLIENSVFDKVRISAKDGRAKEEPPARLRVDRPFQPPRGRKVVVYTGNLEPYQGVDMLIRAFGKVLSEIPDAFLLIVGGNKSQIKPYSAMAKSEGLGPNVHFTGSVSPSVALHYCRQASVNVSPRKGGTNTPLKIYSHLAIGTPLVATGIESHSQVLNDDVAILVDPNPADLSRGIIEVLKSRKTRERLSANAKKLYSAKYSRMKYKEKMRMLLDSLAGNGTS